MKITKTYSILAAFLATIGIASAAQAIGNGMVIKVPANTCLCVKNQQGNYPWTSFAVVGQQTYLMPFKNLAANPVETFQFYSIALNMCSQSQPCSPQDQDLLGTLKFTVDPTKDVANNVSGASKPPVLTIEPTSGDGVSNIQINYQPTSTR